MDRHDVLVVGGGQAGLGMGYRLQKAGLDFTILDAHSQTGDSWRQRWDSLELFTPRPFDRLPGDLKMPASTPYYPRKDDVAEYLLRYRQRYDLPVRNGFEVQHLEKTDDGFVASSATEEVFARQVVIATGPFHTPRIPACANDLDSEVWQGHSHTYRRPADVPPGDTLVVGGGNSAAQIAEELAGTHNVTIASNGPIGFSPRSLLGVSIFWVLHLTSMLRADKDAALSRHVRPYSDTVIGWGLNRLIKKGVVTHVPHAVVACKNKTVTFADGSSRGFQNVLWGTGYRFCYDWVKVDGALDDEGGPLQDRGISPVPGIFWIGLPWQNRLNSALMNGVAGDSDELMRAVLRQHGPTA